MLWPIVYGVIGVVYIDKFYGQTKQCGSFQLKTWTEAAFGFSLLVKPKDGNAMGASGTWRTSRGTSPLSC